MSDAGGTFKIQYWEKIKKLEMPLMALNRCSKGKTHPKKPFNELSEGSDDVEVSYSTFSVSSV